MKTLFDAILAAIEAKKCDLLKWDVSTNNAYDQPHTFITLHLVLENSHPLTQAVIRAFGGLP